MTIRNLDAIFKPRRIAVVGASNTRGTVGYTLLHNLIGSGFGGVVYPVNPKHEAVQGVQAHPSLGSLPQVPDLAVLCTPAATIPGLVRECGRLGIRGAIVISAGFREAGPAGRELEAELSRAVAECDGLRLIGPNCLGVIVPGLNLNASFAQGQPRAGEIAFVSQSGALCTSILDLAARADIGFSYFVSIGNMLDVGMADLIDYLAADPGTSSLVLYVESVTDAREFVSAARAFTRNKPIVAYKAGRFAQSAQAAASHTGALAGVDVVYEAVFQRAGIERVFDVDDMFNCAELLARRKLPRGPRLAIVTNAGGPGVMATDALLAAGGELAVLSPETVERLNGRLPAYWSRGNPVDVLGDAPPERYAAAVEAVLADPNVDALLVVLTPQAMTDATGTAAAVAAAARGTAKPLLASWMGAAAVRAGERLLDEHEIPTYASPEKAVRAFMHLVSFARNRELLYETPRSVPIPFARERSALRQQANALLEGAPRLLTEDQAKQLLALYEIPTTYPIAAAGVDDALQAARRIGFPVVLKILSPQITHKTDVGGVELNLQNEDDVRAAFARMTARARAERPDAEILGVTVQPMVTASRGVELIVGARQDPVFGAVLLVGTGGIAAELFQDRALGLPPLNERLVRRMLESLKIWPLLCGYRGRPGVDLDGLVAALLRFSTLVADCPGIHEIDVNPLLVTGAGVIALDARVLTRVVDSRAQRPYAHLAIHPYPDEIERPVQLRDGTRLVLRPIRPEDEPAWIELLQRCSAQTLWFRFRYLFKEATHEMASRFCYIDYDREMAIVAEREIPAGEAGGTTPRTELLGVGRLVADADRRTAEYAVLVVDAWQGRGLGSLLTDRCLELAEAWDVEEVIGETGTDNLRMRNVFVKRGFTLTSDDDPTTLIARKRLRPPAR